MDEASAAEALASGHSRGKAKRQRAILDAARDIMAESGEGGLTMFALASRAGVSPATPYNLFGSKQAILQAVYEEDMHDFHANYDEKAGTDPLGRIFDLVDFTIAFGGFKQSGIGREGGVEGLYPYLETKTILLGGRPGHLPPVQA